MGHVAIWVESISSRERALARACAKALRQEYTSLLKRKQGGCAGRTVSGVETGEAGHKGVKGQLT